MTLCEVLAQLKVVDTIIEEAHLYAVQLQTQRAELIRGALAILRGGEVEIDHESKSSGGCGKSA